MVFLFNVSQLCFEETWAGEEPDYIKRQTMSKLTRALSHEDTKHPELFSGASVLLQSILTYKSQAESVTKVQELPLHHFLWRLMLHVLDKVTTSTVFILAGWDLSYKTPGFCPILRDELICYSPDNNTLVTPVPLWTYLQTKPLHWKCAFCQLCFPQSLT